jgi:murein DD-endopeptidase MepM/ murein hydrolase activator NlpD
MHYWYGLLLIRYTPDYVEGLVHAWVKQAVTRTKLRRRGSFMESSWLVLAFKPIWEKEGLRVLVGAPLAAALVFSNTPDLAEATITLNTWEVTQPVANILTFELAPPDGVTRTTYTLPVTNLTGISQGFHVGHPGIDFRSPESSPVVAMESGKVIGVATELFGYGHHVEIAHDRGLVTRYAHLDEIKVSLGQDLRAGSVVGSIGLTGWSTGPHLHFEIYENGEAVNPLIFLYKTIEDYTKTLKTQTLGN